MRTLYFCPVVSSFSSSSFFFVFLSSLNLSRRRLDVYHTSTHGVALVPNLGCRSETYCTRLAANAGPKKSRSGHHCTTLLGYIFTTKARIDNRKKNLLNSNVSPTCPHNMVNFSPLAAEIGLPVYGIPANFSGFRILGSVTARQSSSGRQPNFAALNRGPHLYSAGRPPRWALAHILVVYTVKVLYFFCIGFFLVKQHHLL